MWKRYVVMVLCGVAVFAAAVVMMVTVLVAAAG